MLFLKVYAPTEPNPCIAPYKASFHVMFHVLFHLILRYPCIPRPYAHIPFNRINAYVNNPSKGRHFIGYLQYMVRRILRTGTLRLGSRIWGSNQGQGLENRTIDYNPLRVLGPKQYGFWGSEYYNMNGIWALKSYYLGPRTRVRLWQVKRMRTTASCMAQKTLPSSELQLLP